MAINYRQKFKEKLEKNKEIQRKIHEKYDKLLDATNYWEERCMMQQVFSCPSSAR